MNLAEMIGGVDARQPVALRQAVIIGTPAAGVATIRFGDTAVAAATTSDGIRVETGTSTSENISGVRCLDSAQLADGNTVWVLQAGGALIVIGKVGAAGTATSGSPWTSTTGQGGAIQSTVGLELYHPSSTPHIDFHRAGSSAGDSNADYNVRLINEANDTLALRVAAGGRWGVLKIGDGAMIGAYGWDSNWANFGAKESFASQYAYAFMSHSNGEIIVNAGFANQLITLRNNGVERQKIEPVGTTIYGSLYMNDNWVRITPTDVGVYWTNRGYGVWAGQQAGYVDIYGSAHFRNPNGWVEARGQVIDRWGANGAYGGPAGWAWHNNHRIAAMTSADFGDKHTYYMSGAGGACILRPDNVDCVWVKNSGADTEMRFLQDIPVLGGMDMMGRVANANRQVGRSTSSGAYKDDIVDVQFTDDANPVYRLRVRRFKYNEKVANGAVINLSYPNGLVGLIAEEVGQVLFQGVTWWRDADGLPVEPMSIDMGAISSHLVAAVQEQRQRISTLETRLAAVEDR